MGQRYGIILPPYLVLPLNHLLTGDGRCVFDIDMRGSVSSEKTTGREIARAAWKLLNECVRDQGGQGGIVSNIGIPFESYGVF